MLDGHDVSSANNIHSKNTPPSQNKYGIKLKNKFKNYFATCKNSNDVIFHLSQIQITDNEIEFLIYNLQKI